MQRKLNTFGYHRLSKVYCIRVISFCPAAPQRFKTSQYVFLRREKINNLITFKKKIIGCVKIMFSPQISINTCSSPSFDLQQALGDVTNSRNEQVRAWVSQCRKSSHWSLWGILWRNELEKVFCEGIPGNPASYTSLGTMELTQQVTPF